METAVTALYVGSFDPVTLGHVDIARRASAMFDLVVGIGHHPLKKRRLPVEVRESLWREVLPGVRVERYEGLTVDHARRIGARVLVRGIRSPADLEFETPIAQANAAMTGIDTVFLLTDPALVFVSSSLMKEIDAWGGDVSRWLPAASIAALRAHPG